MKTSFISSSSLSQTLRHQLMRMQAELAERQKEVVEGRVADPGIALGANAGRTFSMSRDIERLNGLKDANALAESRLRATQDAMTQISELAGDMLEAATAAASGAGQTAAIREEATRVLSSLTGLVNTNFNGEYLFAGINTDVKPLDDFSDPSSPSKAAFDNEFQTHFGFTQTDPQAATISAAGMENFLTNIVDPQFLGAGWDNWSSASDDKITSRIALNETAKTSLTANEPGLRKLTMAAATMSDLLSAPLNEEARNALYQHAVGLVGQAISDIADAQTRAGIAQNRVSAASERLSAQADLYTRFVQDLEGVDDTEAATRVNDLLTQIEMSYALTARIQQLSLLNHL